MSEVGASSQYVRLVGGELVFSVITDTSSMRIENLRRVSKPQMHWHFRQPRLALIWFRKGCERLRATIDGRSVDHIFTSKSNLAIVPALSEIQGEWVVGPSLDYTVVFLERASVANSTLRLSVLFPTEPGPRCGQYG